MRLTILHTNDVHGRVDGLARVATLVERARAASPHPVLYVDGGDVEDNSVRVSNITKGAAMHEILSAAGCDVACVGNATWLRYGPQVLADAARAASYPLLLANLRRVEGVRPAATFDVGGGRIGFVGITDPFPSFLSGDVDYGIDRVDIVPLVRELARALRADSCDVVVLLSHIGYENPELGLDDRVLARELQGEVDLIVGAHSHTLLPEGDRTHGVAIAQAGSYAEHIGRIEVDGDAIEIAVEPVDPGVPPHPAVVAAAHAAEERADRFLDEQIGVLARPLDVDYVAEIMLDRMGGDVGLAVEHAMLQHDVPAGPLTRRTLWDACTSTANPALAHVPGGRLAAMIARGNSDEFRRATPRPLRGLAHGRLAVVGLDGHVDTARTYAVAATDYELEPYGGLVEREWDIRPRYDFPTIVREAIEEHLRR